MFLFKDELEKGDAEAQSAEGSRRRLKAMPRQVAHGVFIKDKTNGEI
jgi:hypothetical protein